MAESIPSARRAAGEGEARLVEDEPASFWKPSQSMAFAQGTTAGQDGNRAAAPRKGAKKRPREDLKVEAQAITQQNHSFGDIRRILGMSKTLESKLVNNPHQRLTRASNEHIDRARPLAACKSPTRGMRH
ncbi:MAG: hypothetical protein BZY88_09240 [SAR202 cluster bacterium Io17-Chloro-G9]|nr:MAG: hypothetical protein BZY88_09240 [SAR202 cluster bacterium Io17-Chloro-G9]